MTAVKHISFFYAILLVFCANGIHAQHSEYLIKAAFIEKFTKYISWPSYENENFNIAVLGDDAFDGKMKKLCANKHVNNKPVRIHYIKNTSQIKDYQIIFIANNMKREIDDIIEATKNLPVLLIADSYGNTKKGVHISFYITTEDTVHFEIDESALRNSNLEINMLLLQIAKVVKN